MIEFYLEYYNAESFTDEYKQLDTYNLSVRDSACLVKILIDYGMYYETRQLIDKYGYADVDATKLFMFMVHELDASVNEEEYKNKISEYVFKSIFIMNNCLRIWWSIITVQTLICMFYGKHQRSLV